MSETLQQTAPVPPRRPVPAFSVAAAILSTGVMLGLAGTGIMDMVDHKSEQAAECNALRTKSAAVKKEIRDFAATKSIEGMQPRVSVKVDVEKPQEFIRFWRGPYSCQL